MPDGIVAAELPPFWASPLLAPIVHALFVEVITASRRLSDWGRISWTGSAAVRVNDLADRPRRLRPLGTLPPRETSLPVMWTLTGSYSSLMLPPVLSWPRPWRPAWLCRRHR